MTTIQREQVRLSLLRYCDYAGANGYSAELLLQFLRYEGFRQLEPAHLRAELEYLSDKHLITRVKKAISPENEFWRITASGRDLLAGQQDA